MNKTPLPANYASLLKEIKGRIQQAQTRAVLANNAELIRLYWDIGQILNQRQSEEGWGTAVIPRLARELKNELPEVKGFSERNIGRMIAFYRQYPDPSSILPQAVAKLPGKPDLPQPVAKVTVTEKVPQVATQFPDSLLWAIPWGHHAWLMDKVEPLHRLWYMQQILEQGWSRNVLMLMIQSEAHLRQGKALTNFERLLPSPQSDLVQQALKDPYIFDFLTLQEPFHERELETNLLHELQRFLLELGQGFAFVGRQFHLEVGEDDFYVDLLFYHLKLRCFVVIDLKKGAFKPEYAGKMNFYLAVVDDKLRHATDEPTIGLILCQDRKHIVAEYALRNATMPIGISKYELTRALPKSLQSALPTVEEIEAELGDPPTKQIAMEKAKSTPNKSKGTRTQPSAKKKSAKRGRKK